MSTATPASDEIIFRVSQSKKQEIWEEWERENNIKFSRVQLHQNLSIQPYISIPTFSAFDFTDEIETLSQNGHEIKTN